jgi:peptidoglycan/xylan/chitin deacetylase (PgdA/CDA1 family)
MPHNLITTAMRTRRRKRLVNHVHLEKGRQLFVAVTFDVEREYGSHRLESSASNVRTFLTQAEDIQQNATIFIEGSLVEDNSNILRSLEKNGIEIGLHGWRHELWGPAQWYLNDKPLSVEQKSFLLKEASQAFENSRLRRPVLFRAPNLVADESTIKLLEANGFHVDSSLLSHKGVAPVPQFPGGESGIIRIPVSAEPTPLLTSKFFIPYHRFRVCNLKTLKEMKENELIDYVRRITAYQEFLGFLPHLVILCHSWEFSAPTIQDREYSYCSPENFQFTDDITHSLTENFRTTFVSMGALGELLKKKQRENLQNQ